MPKSPSFPGRNTRCRADDSAARTRCARVSDAPAMPPSSAPNALAPRSITLASLGGRYVCSVSSANDSANPAANPRSARERGDARRGASATKMPNGAYATTLARRSKRVQRGGQGANSQNDVAGSGAIHGENGCRLAYTIASP